MAKIYLAPKLVGDFGDDWDATNKSANGKVQSVLSELDSDYIYLTADNELILRLNQGGEELTGDVLQLSEENLQWFEFVSNTAPDGGAWTLDKINEMQIGVSDDTPVKQSFKTYAQPSPITPFSFISAGVEVAGKYVDGKIQIHWMRKLFYYA